MPKAAKASSGPKATGKARHNPLASSSGNATRPPTAKGTKAKAPKASETTNRTAGSTAPATDSKPNYLIHVCLEGEPTVQRLLSIPADFTFEKVHRVLQIAFGWAGCHAHGFRVTMINDKCAWHSETKLRIATEMSMMDLGDDVNEKAETDITLQEVYENPEYEGKVRITYEYDFGDSWEHDFCFLGHAAPQMNKQLDAPDTLSVFCVSGQGHPVAEDCGSVEFQPPVIPRYFSPKTR